MSSGSSPRSTRPGGTTAAGDRWRQLLRTWAIPEPILAAAPANPYDIPAQLFAPQFQACSETAIAAAADALPPQGSVLDIGCASGGASLPLAPIADRITGVDANPDMIALFQRCSAEHAIEAETVHGRWPDVAARVDVHDVAVSHHVAYNVANIEAFLTELTEHARHRVVLELTLQHPQVELNALWQQFHHIERPTRPTLDDLVAVLEDLGVDPVVRPASRPAPPEPQPRGLLVAFARRRLCLDANFDTAIDRALPESATVPPPDVACIWWPGDSTEPRRR